MTEDNSITLNERQLSSLESRLDAIIRLLSHLLPEQMPQREKIRILSETGLENKVIAGILGTTPGTVSKELSVMKER